MGLRCAQARVISEVTSGTTIPNVIGWESVRWSGIRTLARSGKPQGNILTSVTLWWYRRSNHSGYFYNTSPGTRGAHLREWRRRSGKPFCLIFSLEGQIPLTHRRSSKYNTIQEIWVGNPESSYGSKRKVPKFSASNHGADSGRNGGRNVLQYRPPSGYQGRKAWRAENQYDTNDATLNGLVGDIRGTDWRLILHAKNTGACLNVRGNTVTDTVLLEMEFFDFLCARYNVTPSPNLQSHHNRFGAAFDVCHTLSCRKGGLVIARHNKVCDELLYLSQDLVQPKASNFSTRALILVNYKVVH